MSDRDDIVELTVCYCWALDDRDWDSLDAVFTPDATANLIVALVGRDAIKERVRTALERFDATQHLVAAHSVRVEGDTATCRSHLQAQHVVGDDLFTFGGYYADRLVRTPDGWRIAHRDLVRVWTAGDPAIARR